MADDLPSLGEILHRARQAGGAQRARPWPVEDWADRDEQLKALDEAMAEAVAARARIDARLDLTEAAIERVSAELVRITVEQAVSAERDGIRGEVLEVMATYFAYHGNSTAASLEKARDLAEGIRQVLNREPS